MRIGFRWQVLPLPGGNPRTQFERSQHKAAVLLHEHLTPKQSRDLEEKGYFKVRGSLGSAFRIYADHSENVYWTIFGVRLVRFCSVFAAPYHQGTIPVADLLLAQKLTIEESELRFLRNAFPLPPFDF